MVIGEFTYNLDKVILFEYDSHFHLLYKVYDLFNSINIFLFYDYMLI